MSGSNSSASDLRNSSSSSSLGKATASNPAMSAVSASILSDTAKKLNHERRSCMKKLKSNSREEARIDHAKMSMILSNPRTKLVSLVIGKGRGRWQVMDQFDGKPTTFMGLTTRLSQLFFNSSEDSHFMDEESIEPLIIGPDMVESSSSAQARREVVHSRQHIRSTKHHLPRVAKDTSNCSAGDADDVHSSSACKCRGIEHGRLVHEELMQLIMQWNGKGHMSSRLDKSQDAPRVARQLDSSGSSSVDCEEETVFRNSFENSSTEEPDCCTLKIIQYLGCNSLMPLRAELAVFDRQCRTATAIDIVALHLPTWHTVFIEVKTGYAGAINTVGCFTGHPKSGKMRNALSGIDDTPLQRAAAQLLGSYLLLVMGERFDRGVGTIVSVPHEMYILHVNPHAVRPVRYAMPRWTYDRARVANMYENMCCAARLERNPPRALLPDARSVHFAQDQENDESDESEQDSLEDHVLPSMDTLMQVSKRTSGSSSSADLRELKRRQRDMEDARELGIC